MNEPTPLTDAEVYEFSLSPHPDYDGPLYHVPAHFARTLERRCARYEALLRKCRPHISKMADGSFEEEDRKLLKDITAALNEKG